MKQSSLFPSTHPVQDQYRKTPERKTGLSGKNKEGYSADCGGKRGRKKIDISSAIFDPELGCTIFTVERITYTRSREGITSRSRTEQAEGCVHPGTPEMLRLLPEEERQESFIVIYTDYALSTGDPGEDGASFDAPDRIIWNGQTWRVVKVRDWRGFGYVQAWAVRIREDKENRE